MQCVMVWWPALHIHSGIQAKQGTALVSVSPGSCKLYPPWQEKWDWRIWDGLFIASVQRRYMSLVDTFYWLELVKWSCNFKGVRKCRRASVLFGENLSLPQDPWARIPSGVGQRFCCWSVGQKFVEWKTRGPIQDRGRVRQEESLGQQEVPWSLQLTEFSFLSLGRPGEGTDMQYLKVTFKPLIIKGV